MLRTHAEHAHQRHDGEIARFNHCSGLDFPNRGDAHACLGGKAFLGYPGVLTKLAQLSGQPGSLWGIAAVRLTSAASCYGQLKLSGDKLITVKIYH